MILFCTIITSTGQIMWKFGANRLPEIITNIPLLGGFLLHVIAAAIMITAFKTGEVTVLFPMYATNYIWVSLLSYHYFSEPLTALKWTGIASIITGVTLLGIGGKHKHSEIIPP